VRAAGVGIRFNALRLPGRAKAGNFHDRISAFSSSIGDVNPNYFQEVLRAAGINQYK